MKHLQVRLIIILVIAQTVLLSTCFIITTPFNQRIATKTSSTYIIFERKASINSEFVLAKTKESFKLSDLYLLETRLESQVRNWTNPNIIGIDRNTASYLLRIDKNASLFTGDDENDTECSKLSCLNRYDWTTKKVIATGSSGEDLVKNLIQQCESVSIQNLDAFTLEYVCVGFMKDKDFTSKNLISRVAQCIPSPAALNSKTAKTKLVLIETPNQLYLAQRQELYSKESSVTKNWSKRPYQYSSAINPTVALIIVDLLYDLTVNTSTHKRSQMISLLDATCGSGTFLAFALDKGMKVFGNDIKEKCIEGSAINLRYMFNEEMVKSKTTLTVGDFALDNLHGDSNLYDCAVTNLPWGQSTEIKNENDNLKILQRIFSQLHEGAYCAVISKSNVDAELVSVGFNLMGKASIPPSEFVLPTSKKGKKKQLQKVSGKTNCIISIVTK